VEGSTVWTVERVLRARSTVLKRARSSFMIYNPVLGALFTLGKTDFKPLRKFNGANFYIYFAFLSEEPKIIEKIDLAKCPF
jgi:hypothetical protein